MKTFDFEQYSTDWWAIRLGKLASSSFDKLVTNTGKPSASAKTYAYQLVGDLLVGEAEETYQSEWMQRGKELEDEARTYYELTHGVDVKQVGFCLDDNNKWGCSPDGLIGKEGGLEIKCPKRSTHVKYMHKRESLLSTYKQQVQGSLLITGRRWWDLMSYYPKLEPVIVRVKPDEAYQKLIKQELEKVAQNVERIKKEIQK